MTPKTTISNVVFRFGWVPLDSSSALPVQVKPIADRVTAALHFSLIGLFATISGMSSHVVNLCVPAGYSLARSLSSLSSGRRDPTFSLIDDQVSFSLLTPDGPVVVCAAAAENLNIRFEGSGATWLEPQLPGLFGLHDDPPAFEQTGPLHDLCKRYPGIHLLRLPSVFHQLLKIVLHQLVTWEEAAQGWHVMTQRYGEPAPGASGLLVGPTPTKLKSLAYYDLVDCGILPRQARLILRLAREHRRIELAWSNGDESLIRFLSRIPGIGDWTLQTLRGSCLGDADAVVTGDYGLPHTVCWFFRRQLRGTDKEMLELLEPYRGHRYRVQRLLISAGVRAPRRGPKIRLRSWK